MSKASSDDLDALHGVLAQRLLERLRTADVSSADLNVARQFLRDQGVVATPGSAGYRDLLAIASKRFNLPSDRDLLSEIN